MPTVFFPNANPFQFYKDVPDVNPQYNSRLFDEWYFSNTILPWEENVGFIHLWQTTDLIKMQLQCDYGPINLQLIDEETNVVVDTVPFIQIMPNANNPALFIYEITVDLSIYDPDKCYYLKITFGSPIILTLRSEVINLKANQPDTLLLVYSHRKFFADVIFETGIDFQLRIPATLKYKGPASKDTIYIDQVYNAEMIRSVPYNVWTLTVGGSMGIPDYLVVKLIIALGCSDFSIDGRFYTKNESANLEPNSEEDYPMRGWTIELLQKLNRNQRIFEDDEVQEIQIAVMVNSDSKGFATDQGGNESVIEDVI